ncbi:MAG: hypothetical protein KGO96_12710 [Elusimicrobia bacterium]|nr:hypothetical protein [Elusimicrobiota bacterium]
MHIKMRIPTDIDVDAIRCVVPVRYDDQDIPNDFPFRKGDIWDVTIDIATRKIRNWPKRAAQVHMKICDDGSYYLMSGDKVVASINGDYVPGCIPQKYGDYIVFNILEDGTLNGWTPDAGEIKESFFRDNG